MDVLEDGSIAWLESIDAPMNLYEPICRGKMPDFAKLIQRRRFKGQPSYDFLWTFGACRNAIDAGIFRMRAMSRKGARIPSTADDGATDLKTMRSRMTGSRR